jgi:hypothetical protein
MDSRGGRGSARKLSSGKEMLGKSSAATSKQGHRVVMERILRPEAMLQCKQELSMAARAWRPVDGSGMRGAHAGRQQERRTGPEEGENDAWRSSQQEVVRRRWQSGGQGRSTAGGRGRQSRARTRGRRREGRVRGTGLEFSRISGTSRETKIFH